MMALLNATMKKYFHQKNIDSIFIVGRSTKKGHRGCSYIGEKGVNWGEEVWFEIGFSCDCTIFLPVLATAPRLCRRGITQCPMDVFDNHEREDMCID
ncbi:hypothetical protein C5167_047540, partial [Papaver somniferum]